MVSLNPNIPRYFLERSFGEEQLGIYTAVAYLMVVGWTLVSALGQAASPRLSRYYADGLSAQYRRLLARLITCGCVIGVAGIIAASIAGREILGLLYKDEYARSADLFLWLMVGAAISYIASSLTYGIMAARYFFIQLPLYAAVLMTTLVCCAVLIPAYGMVGAAWAVIASSAIQVLGSLCVVYYAAGADKRETLPKSISNVYSVR
jgi:O-antigen/teichoic acid export membrane protein